MTISANADNLATLLVLDKTFEPVPEPIRLQPKLSVRVEFDEYLRFIESLPEDLNVLYFPVRELKRLLEERQETKLIKSFYVDMALAIGKELHFSEQHNGKPTNIYHTFSGCHATKPIRITRQATATLSQILSARQFPVTQPSPGWEYACCLLQDALSNSPTRWAKYTLCNE